MVAPPGSGKTAGMIIPNLLSVLNSCVTLDIKGELYKKTAGYRQKYFNNEIQLFSPFSWDNTLFFNPFDRSIVKDMEYIHIKKLTKQIGDAISAKLFETIIKEEQAHMNYFENVGNHIETLGDTYLSKIAGTSASTGPSTKGFLISGGN